MAYNSKLTSYVGVVESAFRDSGLDFIDFESATEWTAELIGLLGVPYTMVEKVTNGLDGNPSGLMVSDFRCKLPDDLEKLTGVRRVNIDSDGEPYGYSEMVESPDIFHTTEISGSSINTSSNWNPLVNIDEFDPDDETFSHEVTSYELEPINKSGSGVSLYKLDHGYIFTDFKDGYVQVSYRGYPIDADGFPLIPDDPKFKEALKFYIIYKLDWKAWRRNPSPQNKSIVNDSETQYLFYVAAAKTKAHIPSLDKMESIKSMWLRSIPKINEHASGFKTTAMGEKRYNQSRKNRRRY